MIDVQETVNKKEQVAKIANVLMFMAAILVSVSVDMAQHVGPYILFLLSHILWLYYAVVNNQRPVIQLNAFLILIDIYACVVRII